MSPERRTQLARIGKRAAIVVVVAAAFGLGVVMSGGAEPAASAAGDASSGSPPAAAASAPGMAGMAMGPSSAAPLTAPDTVTLTPRAQVLARLRTTAVHRLPEPGVDLHLLGRIEYDEATLRNVTTWIAGRIDHLHVDTTGVTVRRGQTVATLYSPEVYAAHQDLLSAHAQVRRLTSGSELARSAADATLESARQRLRLLGVPDAELAEMERARAPTRAVPIRTPYAGTVVERVATEGSYVQTGATLYRLADLSSLWVQLEAYETDLPLLAVGQSVQIEVQGAAGETIDGTVAFIDPSVDPQRRIARVRVEVPNTDGRLRPAMFVEAVVRGRTADGGRPLVVPETAPLFTGRRSIVYVQVPGAEQPSYQIRVVRLGPRAGALYPVVAGLDEGERVVTEGAFVLDADLQIRGGQSMMLQPDDDEPGPWDRVVAAPEAFRDALAPLLLAYLDAHDALARDNLALASAAGTRARDAIDAFRPEEPREAALAWRALGVRLRRPAAELATSTSLEQARAAFEELTGAIQALLETFGNPLGEELRGAYCSMADGSHGADWLQRGAVIENPYFGARMHDCGEIRAVLEPGSYARTTRAASAHAPTSPEVTQGGAHPVSMDMDAGSMGEHAQ